MLLELLGQHCEGRAGKCLDVGGGGDVSDLAGTITASFADELHAVELEAHVEQAERKGIVASQCDVDSEPLPYQDACFDIILFTSVIEHLYNPDHITSEIARVLKPGGLLVIETPNAVALGRRLDVLAGKNPFRFFNQYNALESRAPMVNCSVFYTAEEIRLLLAEHFDIVETRYTMHTPSVNIVKAALREMAYRLAPRMADCFFVVARRRQ